MAALRCPKCGSFGPAGTAFCAFCGTPYGAGAAPPPAGAPALPTFVTYPAAPPGGSPFAPPSNLSASTLPQEREALGYVRGLGLLLVLGGVLSLVSYVFGAGAVGTNHQLSTSALVFLLAEGGVELVVVGLAWLTFRKLRPIDSGRFTTPFRLTLVLAVALVAILAIVGPLLSALSDFATCSGGATNNTTLVSQCLGQHNFGALIGLTLLFGILALVGLIGMLLGLWRLGDRFQSSYFKVGAILMIFPVLDLVGGVLLYLAAKESLARLERGGAGLPGPPR